MEDNKEIVDWLRHMNSGGICTTVPNTTSEKQLQQVEDGQQAVERMTVRSENPDLSHLRTAIAETNSEDVALSKEVSELISKLQINPQTLADDVKENLHKVSDVLRSEGLADTDQTALIISMDGKRIREKKQQRMNRDLKTKYKELLNRHLLLARKLNYLKEKVGSIRNSIEENKDEYKNEYSSYKLLTAKFVEYNTTADAIEDNIDSMNLKELEPHKIRDKYETFMERRGQLDEINQFLELYNNLPPNLLQAKALLESKDMEYKDSTNKYLNMS